MQNRLKALALMFHLSLFMSWQSAFPACFPPNKLHLNPSPLEKSNITQAQFNQIIDAIEKLYLPVVRSHKARLKINRLWKDDTVNANATQNGKTWQVNMYGGLARRPELTPDGFAMVLCHELGHHLGGYSFYHDSDMPWASNEGQADYFATHACAKEIWKGEAEQNIKARQSVQQTAKRVCDLNFANTDDRDICYRSSNAGLSLATLLAKLSEGPAPTFETPDSSVVSMTYDGHPEAQCRLDTFLAGSVCSKKFNKNIIPAKFLEDKFGVEAETEAGLYSCLARDGWVTAQRPRCWFKPLAEFDGTIMGNPHWSDTSGNQQAEPGEQISLRIPLTNKIKNTTRDVRGELFSKTRGVSVVSALSHYPDIAQGESAWPEKPFNLEIAKTFTCGHPFELIFRASSASGVREFPVNGFVGPKRAEDVILASSSQEHEVPDAPSNGLQIPIQVKEKITVETLAFDLDIGGLYPEENEFELQTPQGQTVKLNIAGKFDGGLSSTIDVKLTKPVSAEGTWVLKVRDLQENDTIKLRRFVLRAPFAERVACQSIVLDPHGSL
jgi:subtilisin-like proprotein convertase family protein